MSQPYPSFPYPPPGPGGWGYPPPDPFAPARSASLLQIIMGCAILLFGGCLWLIGSSMPLDQFNDMMRQQGTDLSGIPGGGQTVLHFMTVFGEVGAVIGIILVVLAIFVRRGGHVAAVLSLILTGLISACIGLSTLSALLAAGGHPSNLIGAVFMCLIFVLCLVVVTRLIAVLRQTDQMRAMAMHQQQQYWMMMQQQHVAGYGYGYPPGGAGPPPPGYPPAPPGYPMPPSGQGNPPPPNVP